jgi:molecular chaperone GrpE
VNTLNPEQDTSREGSSAGAAGADLPPAATEGLLEALDAERERLTADNAALQDRLLRLQAEFDNFRRRAERERSEFAQYAASEFVLAILPALDDFERAMRVETADKEYAKGVELIYQGLCEALKKMGLESIETTGKQFDPTVHQAVQRVETDDADDQAILSEFQRGYNFRGKLLRPAMVQVAVKP